MSTIKKYMLMFVVLSNHVCLVRICIFYFLLTIIVEKLGYTFEKKSLICLVVLKRLRH